MEEEWEDDEEIIVVFEFYDPNEDQLFSIKALLNGYLDGLNYKSSEFCSINCETVWSRSIIGTANDEQETFLKGTKDKIF